MYGHGGHLVTCTIYKYIGSPFIFTLPIKFDLIGQAVLANKTFEYYVYIPEYMPQGEGAYQLLGPIFFQNLKS